MTFEGGACGREGFRRERERERERELRLNDKK